MNSAAINDKEYYNNKVQYSDSYAKKETYTLNINGGYDFIFKNNYKDSENGFLTF